MQNIARFNYVASGLRPHRKIIAVDARADGVTLTLDCGHTSECAPHFTYKIGNEHKCNNCGADAARKLPEFN